VAYDQLSRAWRIAYAILGSFFLLGGSVGAIGEVAWGLRGYVLAWPAAAIAAALAVLGGYLLYAVRQGRIRTLGIGASRGK
jgi:hypothetical protein